MKRWTLDLSDEVDLRLTEIAYRSGVTKAEAMRRAFALLAIADEQKDRPGGFSLGLVRENDVHELVAVGRIVDV